MGAPHASNAPPRSPSQTAVPVVDRDGFEQRPRYRTLLVALREVVASARSLKDLLLNARDLLHSLLDAERVNLFATDPRNTLLWTVARSGGEAPLRLPRTYASIPGFVAITRRTAIVRNAYDNAELRALHPELRHDPARDVAMTSRTRQVLAAPILGERGVAGVIEFVNSVDGMDFRPDDVRLAEEVGRLLGPPLESQLGTAGTMRPESARFGLLLARGLVSDAQLEEAAQRAKKADIDVSAVLIEQFKVPRDAIGQSLADWHHLRFFAWDGRFRMPRVLLDRMTPGFMRAQVCAPLALEADGTLLFAVEHPDSLELLDAIRQRRLAPRIEFVVGLRRDILSYIEASAQNPAPSGVLIHPPLLGLTPEGASAPSNVPGAPRATTDSDHVARLVNSLDERASGVPDVPDEDPLTSGDTQEPDAVIARLVKHMVLDAAAKGASDIHIEPNGELGPCRVRLRIDGDCVDYVTVPALHRQALVQRIKVMADVDIAERRRPQDGRIRVRGPSGTVEVRMASLPTVGENEDVVLRLLSAWRPMPLEDLSFSARNLVTFRDLIAQPYGIVLVVGPTGSGKTTTLHAALGALNTPDMKILTVEDPVEIVQPGLRQVQVNTRIGLGFPETLRAFLRNDPDVIMVGEMRDRVTAAVGIEASLTGHLVLSTLQANSAPETLTRLFGMDVDPLSLADALRGVLAQRLVRRLCDACKVPYSPTPEEWQRIGDAYGDEAYAAMINAREQSPAPHRAVGCSQCRGTGYRGRIAIHEILPGTERIKQQIRARAHLDQIRTAAAEEGVRSMLQDGIEKVLDGHTDFRQVRTACAS
jgi:type II secretory ATPase GspE/PulE/Tfp pilus assembly ATPase PilB-like protein/GAF domain-containing protein